MFISCYLALVRGVVYKWGCWYVGLLMPPFFLCMMAFGVIIPIPQTPRISKPGSTDTRPFGYWAAWR